MKVTAKVARFTGDRKIVEIPWAIRDNFKIGEEVIIVKGSTKNSDTKKVKKNG